MGIRVNRDSSKCGLFPCILQEITHRTIVFKSTKIDQQFPSVHITWCGAHTPGDTTGCMEKLSAVCAQKETNLFAEDKCSTFFDIVLKR